MADRYVVCEGKSVLGRGGRLYRAGTIVKHDQISDAKTGKIEPGLIRAGFIKEFSDRPDEREVQSMQQAQQMDALGSRSKTYTPTTVKVFEDRATILEADDEELRAFAEEYLGPGKGEFQEDQRTHVEEALLNLEQEVLPDSRPDTEV